MIVSAQLVIRPDPLELAFALHFFTGHAGGEPFLDQFVNLHTAYRF